MNLAQKMATIYHNNNKSNKNIDLENLQKAVQGQVDHIALKLYDVLMEGKREVRIKSKYVFPQVIEWFEEEGFIVWVNSQVVVIRIPL